MNKPGRAPRYAHQRGATTLMMVLILLLVVTLIATVAVAAGFVYSALTVGIAS